MVGSMVILPTKRITTIKNKGDYLVMKKIINGKKYDTQSARLIEIYAYGNRGDFHWYSEALYQKKTKEFFLHCEGGPCSKYGETISNNQVGWGDCIKPIDEIRAKEWLEVYGSVEQYEELFGDVEE